MNKQVTYGDLAFWMTLAISLCAQHFFARISFLLLSLVIFFSRHHD